MTRFLPRLLEALGWTTGTVDSAIEQVLRTRYDYNELVENYRKSREEVAALKAEIEQLRSLRTVITELATATEEEQELRRRFEYGAAPKAPEQGIEACQKVPVLAYPDAENRPCRCSGFRPAEGRRDVCFGCGHPRTVHADAFEGLCNAGTVAKAALGCHRGGWR